MLNILFWYWIPCTGCSMWVNSRTGGSTSYRMSQIFSLRVRQSDFFLFRNRYLVPACSTKKKPVWSLIFISKFNKTTFNCHAKIFIDIGRMAQIYCTNWWMWWQNYLQVFLENRYLFNTRKPVWSVIFITTINLRNLPLIGMPKIFIGSHGTTLLYELVDVTKLPTGIPRKWIGLW